MDIEAVVEALDYILDTHRKRHIVGGIFLSMSALFGGIAFTVLSIKEEKK